MLLSADKKHIVSLDLLRGIAALSVCFFHVLSGDAFNTVSWLKAIFGKGYLGLDLFFIISGFIIPYSMHRYNYTFKKLPKFLLKRICRIEPPYIISFLLIVLMRIIHCYIHGYDYTHDWKQFWLHFFYLNKYFGKEYYTGVYWTLAIEFQFYLLVGLLFPFVFHSRKIVPLLLFVIFSAACWFLALPYNFYIFQYGFLFLSGVIFFMLKINHVSLKNFFFLIIPVLILMYFKNELEVVVTTVIAGLAIFMINKQWKVTNFLGRISYSFYLTHLEAAGWFMLYTNTIVTNEIFLRIIAVLFAIIFATIFYYLFERPAFNLSKKIRYG